jgi:hypothetical protein
MVRTACGLPTESLDGLSLSLHLADSRRVGKLALGVTALGAKPTHIPLLLSCRKSVDAEDHTLIMMICC